jgi:hypothetical protein
MPRAELPPGRNKTELKAALQLCDELITQVEHANMGMQTAGPAFIMQFIESADDLSHLLTRLNIQVSPEMQEIYRTPVAGHSDCGDYQPLTEFGLPVCELGWWTTEMIAGLVPKWLQCMREFRDSLAARCPGARRRKQSSKGGRKKKQETIKLERDISNLLIAEGTSLRKNGLDEAQITERLRGMTWTDMIRRINHQGQRAYPFNEATRKAVARTTAWKSLNSRAVTGYVGCNGHIESEKTLPSDYDWAMAEGLTLTTRDHQRTKSAQR